MKSAAEGTNYSLTWGKFFDADIGIDGRCVIHKACNAESGFCQTVALSRWRWYSRDGLRLLLDYFSRNGKNKFKSSLSLFWHGCTTNKRMIRHRKYLIYCNYICMKDAKEKQILWLVLIWSGSVGINVVWLSKETTLALYANSNFRLI